MLDASLNKAIAAAIDLHHLANHQKQVFHREHESYEWTISGVVFLCFVLDVGAKLAHGIDKDYAVKAVTKGR